jgi:hypothetical protein
MPPLGSRVADGHRSLCDYAAPIWVHNTAAILNIDRDTFSASAAGALNPTVTSSPKHRRGWPGKPDTTLRFRHREARGATCFS